MSGIEVYPLGLYVSPEKLHFRAAAALRGNHVNIKLRDGTVIINVLLLDVRSYSHGDDELLIMIRNKWQYKRTETMSLRHVQSITKIPDWKLQVK